MKAPSRRPNTGKSRRADQALRESELRFRALVEGSIQGIAVFRGHRAVFANPAFARIAGYDAPEEILALPSFAVMTHPEDLERLEGFLTAVIKGQEREPAIEFRGVRRDGRVIWVNAVVTPLVWNGLPSMLVAMLDITERKQAADRLRGSEERFRNLIEGSIQGIVIHRDYRPLFANQALADMFGYGSPEEIMRLPSLDVLNAPEIRESARRAHGDRLRGRLAPARYELEGLRKDGSRIWLECLARVVPWEGEPAVQYTLVDITDRKQSEAAVRSSHRLLQAVLDAIPLCIFTKDRAGRIVFANRAQCEFDGLTPAQITGLATEEYPNRTPEQIAQNLDWDRRVIQNGEHLEIPAYVRQDAAGRSRWLRGFRLPLRDEQGQVVGQLGVNEDITAQREAELALRRSEERYRNLVEGSVQGILILRNFRILFANKPFALMHGYDSPEEVLRVASSLELLAPEEHPRVAEYFRQYREKLPVPTRLEVRAMRRDGSAFWRESVLREIVWEDGLPAIQVTTQDITDRKTAEQQRESLMAHLRRANEDLRDFAYIVSHDLKAPLRGIGSLAEWLAEDHAHRLDAEGRELLDLLRQRTRRMAALLEGILTYSRVGRAPASPLQLNCGKIVREVIDTLAPPPGISVMVEEPLPDVVFDAAQLTQVFQNLIGNAIQHLGKPSGTVRIAGSRSGGVCRFSVADDGIGIEPRHFERIFKIFQRLRPDEDRGGTGIGLSVVKKIIESQGGEVGVDSTPGQGSVFWFTIRDQHP